MKLTHKSIDTGKIILGFDIGGTTTAIVLGTLNAQVINRTEIATSVDASFEDAIKIISSTATEFLQAWSDEGISLPSYISVAVGGPLDIANGIVYSPPHLPNWNASPLKSALQAYFGIPVYVEHDGNAGALAEYFYGAGCGTQNMIFLTMGTGFGAGIILNGRIYHGSTDMAGEVGHIRLSKIGPIEYGKEGSWEAFCSGKGMVSLALWRNPEYWPATLTTAEIVERALSGEPQALELVAETGKWLGHGIAILVDLLNPELIVVGTLGALLKDLVLEPARQVMMKEALPTSAAACQIVPVGLGSSLGDIACLMAACIALRTEN